MSVDTKVTPIPADAFSVEEKTGDTPAVNEAEFAAAEAAAKAKAEQGNASAYVHKLKKPFTFEGCTIEELSFDFDRLTGNDSLAIEDELQSMNKPVIVPTFSGQYLIRMAALHHHPHHPGREDPAHRRGRHPGAAHRRLQPNPVEGADFFAGLGAVTCDGGAWLRKQCLIMAQNNNTPVSYWAALPLSSLTKWIKASNLLVEEQRAKRPKKAPRPVVIRRGRR